MYTFYMMNTCWLYLIFSLTSFSYAIASYSSCLCPDKRGSTNGILVFSSDLHILDDTKGLGSPDHYCT